MSPDDRAILSEPARAATKRGDPTRQAVIDIGSNSIRLVIYDGPRRAPAPICNEKALCGLGRDMSVDGRLHPEAAAYALATLKRFRLLLDGHGDPPTIVVATAAVREAVDGPDFVREVAKIGFKAAVIDGAEEARLSALGVVSYEPDATGLVGDMGGGSLELVAVENGVVRETSSLSIGPFRLMQKTGGAIAAGAPFIERALDEATFLGPGRFETLYAVGGAWRAVARIHMRLRSYPLSVLHHYEMTRAEALDVCQLIAKQSRRSLEEIPGIPRRRLETLPFAALVLTGVLNRTAPRRIVISAGGLREGALFDALTPAERLEDPLLAGARFLAERYAPDAAMGRTLAPLTAPLFLDESAAEARVRMAACLLCDLGAYFHPDLRSIHAYDTALRASLYGATHTERIAIAWSLFVRHDGEREDFPDSPSLGLLSWDHQQRATRLGLALRFASAFAPKAAAALSGVTLRREGARLTLRAPARARALMSELPRRRFEALAAAFDSEAVEDYY